MRLPTTQPLPWRTRHQQPRTLAKISTAPSFTSSTRYCCILASIFSYRISEKSLLAIFPRDEGNAMTIEMQRVCED
jgi:hypothetical protein